MQIEDVCNITAVERIDDVYCMITSQARLTRAYGTCKTDRGIQNWLKIDLTTHQYRNLTCGKQFVYSVGLQKVFVY